MVFKQYSKYYKQQNIQSNNDEADITKWQLIFPHFMFHVHDCHLSLIQARNEVSFVSTSSPSLWQ